MTTNIQPVCEPCTRERADVVRHANPCESVYEIRLRRVQAGLANLQEDLRACITEARAAHHLDEAHVLNDLLMKIEQDTQALLVEPFHRFSLAAREGAEAEAGPSHFSEEDGSAVL